MSRAGSLRERGWINALSAGYKHLLKILDLPAAAAPVFGKIRADLQKKGTPVGNFDLLIAAHAIYLNLTLVTNNAREFERIPELSVENWL